MGVMERFLSHYSDSFGGAIMPGELASYRREPSTSKVTLSAPAPTSPQVFTRPIEPRTNRFFAHNWATNFEDAVQAHELFDMPNKAETPQPAPLNNKITEFALGVVTEKHSLWNKKIKIGNAGAIGLKLDEKIHRSGDAAVQKDAIRRVTTEKLTASGKKVVWAEAIGVAELGAGKSGTLALGGAGSASAGFSGSSLVRYRTVQPVVVGTGESPEDTKLSHRLGIPTEASHLVGVAAGTEFEIQGKGTVTGKASVGVGKSLGTSLISLGASARAGASVKHSGEVALNVKILDESGLVQVTLTDIDETTAQASANLHAGLQSTLVTPPAVGDGILKHLLEMNLLKPFTGSLNKLASTTAEVSASVRDGNREVGTYTLDVSSENGLKAYKSLLLLNTESADALSQVRGSGVRSIRMTDTSEADEFKAKMNFAGKCLLLHHSLTEEREGRLSTSDGTGLMYRENKFKKEKSNVVTGSQEVTWDAVSVKVSEEDPSESFFNMKFKANNLFTCSGAVGRFFRFSSVLGVEPAGATDAVQSEISMLDKMLTNQDDTTVDVDIYFTQAGLDKIRGAGQETSRKAYYQARKEIEPALSGLESLSDGVLTQAETMAKRYVVAMKEAPIENSGGRFEMSQIESDYRTLTGRAINNDYLGLSGGQDFAGHLGKLSDTEGDESLRAFFSSLGRSTEFQFMPSLAALTSLAGREETLVNNLSMTGENVHIDTVSEGMIEHPTKTISKLVAQHQINARPEGSPV